MATRAPRRNKKPVIETYEVVVIGGGSAGLAAAESARAAGAKKVCLVEHGMLGGECPVWACVPTKSLLRSAKLYYQAKHSLPQFGIRPGRVQFSLPAIIKRKNAVVQAITGGGEKMAEHAKRRGITVRRGNASFANAKTLDVGDLRLRAQSFVIATGSKEVVLDIPGIEEIRPWYSRELVSLERLPASVVLIGGGPVGCEFATFFALLGVPTTIVEAGAHLLPREDVEIAALVEANLKRQGVRIMTRTTALACKKNGRGVLLTVQTGRRPRQALSAEVLAVTIGRRPNIDGLALERAGIRRDERGSIVSGKTCASSVAHIFVAGDARGGMQFTHLAHYEGSIAGWNAALRGSQRTLADTDLRVVPRVTFVEPEVASVGLTPAMAKRQKLAHVVYRFPVGALGRAAVDGGREGLLKVVVSKTDNTVLGAHLVGERAGEVIHELALAIHAQIPFNEVQKMMHAYPTWSESIPAAFI